ncbi:AMP-binding protein [Zavarzinia compransoris]|uniref:ATP-dependent acyl-CoA ligase n=1 Tax=Zavarzinia compransoris TaxID=1264899 RepID=A0A317E5I6_9PROT|nr:AMP-binding protein [Zavarzinia compransoris]PWR21624.1 hypothetical protein DKG75_06385 [Zavarzinia compransoris]TDP45596.1 crotonobetaine/carnitine-CoA ligase [Zavarzinia compransoris]
MQQFRFDDLPTTLHHLLDSRAEALGAQTYAIVGETDYSYRQIAAWSRLMAARLHALGVRPGQRVVVLMEAGAPYLALWFALSRVGAVETPINPAYRGLLLKQLIETAEPSLSLVAPAYRDQYIDACGALVPPERVIDPAALLDPAAAAADLPALPVGRRDTAAIIFTSGTTGRSKGVMISQRQQLSFGQAFREITALTTADTTYNFLPFFHIAAKFLALGTMLAGGRMVLRNGFSLSAFWPEVRRHGVTVTSAVGGLCHMLYSQEPAAGDADNPMRLIYAVPIPWEFKTEFEQRFALTLVEGYGSTENNLIVFSRAGEATPRGSCGRASPYFEIQIQDELGDRQPPGVAGEICVRPKYPDTLLQGYFGMPDKTLEVLADLWFHSGDRGYMDETGYVFFLDRLKDAIRRRGENISSFEVERVLNSHHAVAETAVIPHPSELAEDEVKAIVVLKPGRHATHEDILRHAADNMPHFMVPRFIEFRDVLPRTPTMKIRKQELKAEGNSSRTWDCEAAGLQITRKGIVRKNATA